MTTMTTAAHAAQRIHQAPERAAEPQPCIAPGAIRKMPLDEAHKFAGEIWWTDDVQLDVFTAALAAIHTLHSFNTTFQVVVRSKEKRTGKTTTSDVVEILGHNAWRATQSTSHAV